MGFYCLEMSSADNVITHCSENIPDIVLLDWNLPNADGLEILAAIRRHDALKLTKVFICTAERNIDNIVLALEAGADECLMKPFNGEALETKLYHAGAI